MKFKVQNFTPVPAVLLLSFLLLPAQTTEPLFGNWRLDLSKSGPSAYSRVIVRITPSENDGLKVVYDMIGMRGGVTHWEWTGKLDGKDYALQGVEDVITNAYARTGPGVYAVVTKLDGRIAGTTTVTISPDGQVMTVTSSASTAVYTKQ